MRKIAPVRPILGFVVTPSEIADRVASLDAAVKALDTQIEAKRAKIESVNASWLQQWHAFQRRWALERDAYASDGSRWFATRAIPMIEGFEKSYRWWAGDFERRSGLAVKGAAPAPVQRNMVPTWAWLVGGAAVLIMLRGVRLTR